MTKQGLLDIYSLFGWVTIGIGVAVLLVSPIVKKWMHLDTLEDHQDLAGDRELAEPQAAGHPRRARDEAVMRRASARAGIVAAAVLAARRVRADTQAGDGPDQRSIRSPRPTYAIRRRRR